ncbi:hypothetical protein EDB89DRAFT_611106 [Lactarius sanguifluus]|nr:hypothetical protein EDB89DRAFT_611106 [Lactarius sanguifluus]
MRSQRFTGNKPLNHLSLLLKPLRTLSYPHRHKNHSPHTMGSVVSAIGGGINAIISAIAGVLETIIGAIVAVIVTIFDLIFDILCCRCCGSNRRTGTRRGGFRRRGFTTRSRRTAY